METINEDIKISKLENSTYSRFSSAEWFDKVQNLNVRLAGIGGIGSYVGFFLSRLGVLRLFLYDDDKVEPTNMSGQLYNSDDVGRYKTAALKDMITSYSKYYNCVSFPTKYTDTCKTSDVMICGFDNMEARKVFYNSWKKHVMNKPEELRKSCLFIDGRLTAEEYQVLCITGDDEYSMNLYETEYLFNDSEAESTICSYKQTSHIASMCASMMVNLLVNFAFNLTNPTVERIIPFFTSYNGELCLLKTK